MFKFKDKVGCPHCGYSLATLPQSGRCPECGSRYRSVSALQYKLFKKHTRSLGRTWLTCTVISPVVTLLVVLAMEWPWWTGHSGYFFDRPLSFYSMFFIVWWQAPLAFVFLISFILRRNRAVSRWLFLFGFWAHHLTLLVLMLAYMTLMLMSDGFSEAEPEVLYFFPVVPGIVTTIAVSIIALSCLISMRVNRRELKTRQ